MTPKEEEKLKLAYQNVFLKSTEGQLVLWDLINRCHVFKPFGQQNAGAYAKEGQRELGLHLMHMVHLTDRVGGAPGPERMERIINSLSTSGGFLEDKEDEKDV